MLRLFPHTWERPGYWVGVTDNIGDELTYWIFDDQSKQILPRSVVRPYNANKRVKWDPALKSSPIKHTAQNGGETKPSKDEIDQLLSTAMDKYDEQEPEPVPIPTANIKEESNTSKKPSVLKYRPMDLGMDPPIYSPADPGEVYPVTNDDYDGPSKLRYSHTPVAQHPDIPIIRRSGRISNHKLKYKEKYHPPEVDNTVPKEELKQNVTKEESKPSSKGSKKKHTKWSPSFITRMAMTAVTTIGLMSVPTKVIADTSMDLPEIMMGHNTKLPEHMAKPIDDQQKLERLRAYHGHLDQVNSMFEEDPEEQRWKVQFIEQHKVGKDRNGNKRILLKVRYADGPKAWHDLDVLRHHDPLLCITYAYRNGLVGKYGWSWIKEYMESDQAFGRMVKAYKTSRETGRKFKFGIEVPRNAKHASELDKANDNAGWRHATDLELEQINDHKTFRVVPDDQPIPKGYKRIPYHIVYDVKFDGRLKARLVAGGHRSPEVPREDVFSGVVSMEAVRIGFILARMNDLMVCAGDVGNAFLYGKTREKVYIIAGPEFGPELEGKRLIVDRSLYGLKTSAARFHEHLSAKLRNMGFRPSKADPDLWMRKCKNGTYEYIARFVNDVIAFSKDPMAIMNHLKKSYTMKGVGKPQYYLGGDVVDMPEEWHKEGIFTAFSAETYIKNCIPKLETMCGVNKFASSKIPFDPNYHPELDDSPLCNPDTISKYRSLIGSANWIVTLGRFDICYALSTLSRYSMAPCEGHFKAMQKVFGYLMTYPQGKILIDIGEAPIRRQTDFNCGYSWTEFYPDACENVPDNMPIPKGKTVKITIYVDADHARDKVTCRSVTGIIVLLNNTPIIWLSKRQKTVETSTYGSELVAGRIATDLLIEMRYKMRMLGVPLEDSSVMVGDNMSVVLNTRLPSSNLKKKCQAVNYHRIREAIAAGFTKFGHIDTKLNVADICTKPLPGTDFHLHTGRYLFRRSKQYHKGVAMSRATNQA